MDSLSKDIQTATAPIGYETRDATCQQLVTETPAWQEEPEQLVEIQRELEFINNLIGCFVNRRKHLECRHRQVAAEIALWHR